MKVISENAFFSGYILYLTPLPFLLHALNIIRYRLVLVVQATILALPSYLTPWPPSGRTFRVNPSPNQALKIIIDTYICRGGNLMRGGCATSRCALPF
jgi:hypothetical protein